MSGDFTVNSSLFLSNETYSILYGGANYVVPKSYNLSGTWSSNSQTLELQMVQLQGAKSTDSYLISFQYETKGAFNPIFLGYLFYSTGTVIPIVKNHIDTITFDKNNNANKFIVTTSDSQVSGAYTFRATMV